VHEIHFSGVEQDRRQYWKEAIEKCLSTLPESEKQYVPPVYIYNTVVQALSCTFDPHHPFLDKLIDKFSKNRIWTFCFLADEELRNPRILSDEFQRIIICNNRIEIMYDVCPERSFFHEVYHFVDLLGNRRKYTEETKDQVEEDCEIYATMAYIRLLLMNPTYETCAYASNIREFETAIRKKLTSPLSLADATEKAERIRDEHLIPNAKNSAQKTTIT
jgi:hypothetical protein